MTRRIHVYEFPTDAEPEAPEKETVEGLQAEVFALREGLRIVADKYASALCHMEIEVARRSACLADLEKHETERDAALVELEKARTEHAKVLAEVSTQLEDRNTSVERLGNTLRAKEVALEGVAFELDRIIGGSGTSERATFVELREDLRRVRSLLGVRQ